MVGGVLLKNPGFFTALVWHCAYDVIWPTATPSPKGLFTWRDYMALSIESNQIAECKRDNLIARRIGQCIADRPCVLDFWSPDQCLIAHLNDHRTISC